MRREIQFRLNGEAVAAQVAPHETLVEVLRDEFGLLRRARELRPGHVRLLHRAGERRARSRAACISPACAEDADVRTIEELGRRDARCRAAGVRRAPARFQCGFCTPGFVLMTRQLLDEHPDPNEDDIRHYLSGNLCRCAAYPEIIEAVKLAARKRRKS